MQINTFFLIGFIIIAFSCSTCRITQQGKPLERFEYETEKMGTTLKLILYSFSTHHAEKGKKAVFERIDELNNIFSDYQADSEVSQLSGTSGNGQKVKVSPEMHELLSFSKVFWEKSDSAFDVTIGAASKLWRKAIRQQKLPTKEEIAACKNTVGSEFLVVNDDSDSVELQKKGTRLDFGGIAKGYALDEAFIVLKRLGIVSAMIDFGGDIYVGANPPDAEGWKVKIESTNELKILEFKAIATSGNRYQYVEIDGVQYSHIVHPKTCIGLTHNIQTTVIADYGFIADALASATNVLNKTIEWENTETFILDKTK